MQDESVIYFWRNGTREARIKFIFNAVGLDWNRWKSASRFLKAVHNGSRAVGEFAAAVTSSGYVLLLVSEACDFRVSVDGGARLVVDDAELPSSFGSLAFVRAVGSLDRVLVLSLEEESERLREPFRSFITELLLGARSRPNRSSGSRVASCRGFGEGDREVEIQERLAKDAKELETEMVGLSSARSTTIPSTAGWGRHLRSGVDLEEGIHDCGRLNIMDFLLPIISVRGLGPPEENRIELPAGFSLVVLSVGSGRDITALSKDKLRSRLPFASKSMDGTAYTGRSVKLLFLLPRERAEESWDEGSDCVDWTVDETVEARLGPVIS
ncbi:hypothetical protein RRF57_008799 [Xylaria bambusicola]|uniref:Uncharacterized protein n=1 Tax=Xylaria bambusicola TaxID=326684 RepID=A0AAN7UIH0_9PEZI